MSETTIIEVMAPGLEIDEAAWAVSRDEYNHCIDWALSMRLTTDCWPRYIDILKLSLPLGNNIDVWMTFLQLKYPHLQFRAG